MLQTSYSKPAAVLITKVVLSILVPALKSKRSALDDASLRLQRHLEKLHLPQVLPYMIKHL